MHTPLQTLREKTVWGPHHTSWHRFCAFLSFFELCAREPSTLELKMLFQSKMVAVLVAMVTSARACTKKEWFKAARALDESAIAQCLEGDSPSSLLAALK
jgi:hypothetical protein